MRTRLQCLAILMMGGVLCHPEVVCAETVYLKNGTLVKGRIVKEDEASFAVETPDGRRKVAKADVELVPAADPNLAMVSGLVLAGAGQFYDGAWGRGAFFLGLSSVAGGAGYAVARQVFPNSTASQWLGAAIGYGLSTVVGALDARALAESQGKLVRYHVTYDN